MSDQRRYLSYAEAEHAWGALRLTERQLNEIRFWQKRYAATRCEPVAGNCPVCGFPRYGFVTYNWPQGHPCFGIPVCCPRCWPAPLGENPDVMLPASAAEEAQRAERAIAIMTTAKAKGGRK